MERALYQLLTDIENKSWWFKGRSFAASIFLLGKRFNVFSTTVPFESILDYGSGEGGMCTFLSKYGPVSAFEPYHDAYKDCLERPYAEVFNTAPEKKYGLVAMFDVLAHIEDEDAALENLPLQTGGYLLITTTAWPFLFSAHDRLNHAYRRHTKAGLRAVLENHGYRVERMSFWNMFSFPIAIATRLSNHTGYGAMTGPLNWLFTAIIYVEVALMYAFNLPFGLSLITLAIKT